MKTQHLLLLACAATVLGVYAAEPTSNPPVVALRFVTAAGAFTAVQQKLGTNAAEAVSRVDEKRNTVALNSDHSQAAIVRAFLTGFDHQPPEIRVDATITRHREATASSPALWAVGFVTVLLGSVLLAWVAAILVRRSRPGKTP